MVHAIPLTDTEKSERGARRQPRYLHLGSSHGLRCSASSFAQI
jgi:hypothetical protein